MSVVLNFLYAITALLAVIVIYFKWKFTYWKRKGLPYLEPTIPFGNNKEAVLQQMSIGDQYKKHYETVKNLGLKHCGLYSLFNPVYIFVDTELIKSILQKDFDHFSDRGMYYDEQRDPLSAHLVSLGGPKWKKLRSKLTPTFSSGKMKIMFDIVKECSKHIHPILQASAKDNKPVDIKEILACFTTDVISSCAFGLDTSCLKNPDSSFRKYGKEVFENSFANGIRTFMKFTLPHKLLTTLNIKTISTDVEKFFFQTVKENLEIRKNMKNKRNDLFQMLIDIQEQDPSFNFNTLSAQAFVFFIAGFETSSSAMSFALLELCLNEDIQEKLRNEVNKVLIENNNELTYDAIMQMTYLDQVIDESLRKYPPFSWLVRNTTKDYIIPGTDTTLEIGTKVFISISGIHKDPEYYPNPEVFDPDRFSPTNKKNRPGILHIPFGDGPRNCIGLRFGLMQIKIGLISLITKYRFTLNEKTKLPLKYDTKTSVTSVSGCIWVNVAEL